VGLVTAGPELLTVAEVAARLRLRPVTVYRLCERGELPHLRVSGNAIRVRLEHLEAYLTRRSSWGRA
jgi:excisionase family DNA binding protein